MAIRSFEDLEVWKRGCSLAVFVYECFRDSRDFRLKDQMQRAAVSIPSNFTEGHEKSTKDFSRFLSIARGSSAELRTQAYIAYKVNSISVDQKNLIVAETQQINRILTGLTKYLKKTDSRS